MGLGDVHAENPYETYEFVGRYSDDALLGPFLCLRPFALAVVGRP